MKVLEYGELEIEIIFNDNDIASLEKKLKRAKQSLGNQPISSNLNIYAGSFNPVIFNITKDISIFLTHENIIKIEQMLSEVKSIRKIFKPIEFEGFKKKTSNITKNASFNSKNFSMENLPKSFHPYTNYFNIKAGEIKIGFNYEIY